VGELSKNRTTNGVMVPKAARTASIAPRRTMPTRPARAASTRSVGVVVGIGVSMSATRLLAGFLFGVTATNVPTYVTVAVALAVVTVLVTLGPVLRAVRSDPAVVLRAE